jgi:hypothetical protein
VESAQIAVGADFGKFDRLQAEEMGIFFPTGVAMSRNSKVIASRGSRGRRRCRCRRR